jgi:hypothetical protein
VGLETMRQDSSTTDGVILGMGFCFEIGSWVGV